MRLTYAIFTWLVVAAIPSFCLGQTRPAEPPATHPARAAVIAVHGEINDFSYKMLVRHFEEARKTGAQTLVIDIDTLGGSALSGLEMSQFLKQQTGVHTIAYIHNKAYSAGTMVALACDEIVMAEHAWLGDCAPILARPEGGIEAMPETERSKAESPIVEDFRTSAQRNGYSVPLVLSMVTLKPIYYIERANGTDRRYVFEKEFQSLTDGKEWRPVPGSPNPVLSPDTLLTVSGKRALEVGLARSLAESRDELVARNALTVVGNYEMGKGEIIVDFLNKGLVRALLLTIFMTSLYVALHAPGHGGAEVIAVLALALLIGVPLLTGYAQWWEIVAIFLGIALLAIELFLIPGFGVVGFSGIALILLGLLMTFVAPEPGRSPLSLPRLPITWQYLQNGLLAVVGAMACSLVLSFWLRRYLPRIPYFNRLILNATVGGSDAAMAGSLTNIDPMQENPAIGAIGKTITDLKPGGSAEFRDPAGGTHIVSVVSDSGFVAGGSSVVVREVGCGRVLVRPVAPKENAPA